MTDKTMEIVERLARIETMLQSNMELLNNKASIQEVKALEDRVSKLESANVWLTRTVGGIIIGGIMAGIMISSKM